MLQCGLEDGRSFFINLDRVVRINNQPDGSMVLVYLDPEGSVQRTNITRFQIIKTGTWHKADRG